MDKVTVDWLQSIEAIKDVPADQLQWWIDNSEHFVLPAEEALFRPGERIRGTLVVVSGRIKAYLQQRDGQELGIWAPKSITGYLPFSRLKTSVAYGMALEDTQLMLLPSEKMPQLIRAHYELTQALVHIMTDRVREYTSLQLQSEKMMALGKLSAGLAHELNNPAAAVVRGAVSLKQHLQLVPDTFRKLTAIQMSPADVDIVNNKLFAILSQEARPALSMMERSEKEEELLDWLDQYEIENREEIAENFVDFGFTAADLDEFMQHIPQAHISPVFNWINSNLITERMVTDIEEASRRIATLVSSVKNFTHMDQGQDKQLTDIHSGIKNTLTILQHRLRKGNIEVVQHFDTSLPPVKAYIGALNQVWTNLIDNALDAMEPAKKGVLEIRTEKDHDCVLVSVTDNGAGIPEDIRSRIFDPFFTTKEIGKGTGLGLDIVSQIVRRHRGTVKVQSAPGRTQFTVALPINNE
ncbi:sensor histidine kinase [Chitinophaga japonensis]|uniref:histidine kinase n=1 Tax=Chitinophaga japonensis TaxID=104662 RepID=A0A562SSZ6_CHIJA|nr:ATP-binding protein [Chitinophaga japonensis]TWI84409.1 histidine kinase/DNA gyrase B/HSP90-like ATPase [Chitinophaga japonensis]